MEQIVRKFLVKKLPDISGIIPRQYERYILTAKNGQQRRIQSVDGKLELEELN